MNENEIGDIIVACAIQLHPVMKLGYLLNFGEALMKDGIRRTINGQIEAVPRDSVAP